MRRPLSARLLMLVSSTVPLLWGCDATTENPDDDAETICTQFENPGGNVRGDQTVEQNRSHLLHRARFPDRVAEIASDGGDDSAAQAADELRLAYTGADITAAISGIHMSRILEQLGVPEDQWMVVTASVSNFAKRIRRNKLCEDNDDDDDLSFWERQADDIIRFLPTTLQPLFSSNLEFGASFTACLGGCVTAGFYGFHVFGSVGGAGLGATANIHALAGRACAQEGWLNGFAYVPGVGGGLSVPSDLTGGGGVGDTSSPALNAQFSVGAQVRGAIPIAGGSTHTWMSGC